MTAHIYRIAYLAGSWRLMRDNVLHSTYESQGAAKAGMATEQRRDEARTSLLDSVPPEKCLAYSMHDLIARLWRDATYSPQYSLVLWEEFKERFDDIYARAYAARKGE